MTFERLEFQVPRSRNIKPGFFTNGDLIACDPLTRLLFIGLWTEADPRGILEDRPATLKARLLPGDLCDVNVMLDELQQRGFIRRYAVNGVHCIQIVNFSKHQNPHIREQSSDLPEEPDASTVPVSSEHEINPLPEPVEHPSSIVQTPDQHDARTMPAPDLHDASTLQARLIPDSGFLIPDSQEHTLSQFTSENIEKPLPLPAGRVDYPNAFDEFWKHYPRGHGNKKQTFAQWRRLKPDAALREAIMLGLARWVACDQWQRGFVKHAERWLRDRMWEDDPPTGLAQTRGPTVVEQNMALIDRVFGKVAAVSNGVVEVEGRVL